MSIFKKLVIDQIGSAVKMPGIPFAYSDKLDFYANSIQQGKIYTVGGRESGGKRSFVDMHFFLGAYMSWYAIPEDRRPPLKILYFNMDKPIHIKMQKWLCTYMYLAYGEFIDVNTLNGGRGKLYDIDDEMLRKITEAQGFFDYMIDNEILQIFNGPRNPTSIDTTVKGIMNEVGTIHKEKGERPKFEYDEGYENQITLIIVDNVEKITSETRDGSFMNPYQVQIATMQYLHDLNKVYRVSPVIIVPTVKVTGVSLKKDMVPDFREFGEYFRNSDVAINCFNPHAYIESSSKWKGYELPTLVTNPDSIGRLRTIHIMRNTMGVDNVTIPYIMHPENGVYQEAPSPTNDLSYRSFINDLKEFKNKVINSKNG